MRIIIFTAWGGIWPVPILKKILSEDNIDVIKIYSQGIHETKINRYSDFFSKNYKDNIVKTYRNYLDIDDDNWCAEPILVFSVQRGP